MKRTKNSYFLPYQKKWILDNSRLKILEKSRQIGMTLATAYNCVRTHMAHRNTYDTWVCSRDEIQAKLFIDDCKKISQILSIACDFFGKKFIESKQKSRVGLKFSNGSTINAISSSVDSQAGKRGSRVLDEFALHNYQKNLFITAIPGITWGGRLEILSTHRGANNFFNQLIQEVKNDGNPKNFSYHRVTLQDALEQGFLQKLKAQIGKNDERFYMSESEYFDFVKKSCPDEDSFLQEYMCQPLDDNNSFISTETVIACEYPDIEWQTLELKNYSTAHGDFFLGIDIGRTNDLTVFWLLEDRDNMLLTRKVVCLKNMPFSHQEAELQKLFSISSIKRVCIDQTGIGRQFFERASEHFGNHRVEGILFNNRVKENFAYMLRETLENQSIRIPSDEFIRADIRAIKRETTFAGNFRFASKHTNNGHADRFWALALAIHAASTTRHIAPMYLETIERRSVKYL